MSFATGDFSSFTRKSADQGSFSRNALSTVKKRQCQRRKFVNIKPLQKDVLKKEFEEDDERPFWEAKPLEEESEKENEVEQLNSFESNFVCVITPEKKVVKDGAFATPHAAPLPMIKINRMLNFQYITPNNKVPPPKVQCSVNMQTYLKTPISEVVEGGDVCDFKPLSVQPRLDFEKIEVNNVEYVVLNEIGKGGSSKVFHCFDSQSKNHRAIKCVSLENKTSAGFINEIKMLKNLQKCNRIIKMFDYEIKEKVLLVVLEVGGSDLSKILKESALNTDHMPLYMVLYYWMEMLYAVKQIHYHGIIHSDLKPANFLKVEGYLKLIDFGIATCIQSDMTSVIKSVPEGSFNYISPEALNNENSTNVNSPSYGKPKYKLSFKSDVWSLGCILYQLVYRRTPFQHVSQMWVKLSMIMDPNHKIDYPTADWVPQKIIKTIKNCLQFNVKLRPGIDDLIAEYEEMFFNLL